MFRAKSLTCIYLLVIIAALCQGREVRALWAMPWDISSPEKIEQLVSDAVANNQNEILAEVRYRSDAMYIPNKYDSLYFNPEPRSYVLSQNGFDPLEYLLFRAHEHGLTVQAWLSTLNATPTSTTYLRSNYIYKNHDEWIMKDNKGNRMRADSYMGYFVDPGIPDVKYHLMNVILDIVSNYPELDGIHLDYIRYPSKSLGYAPESIERYREKSKSVDITWNDWRITQITEFIRDLREMALTINPKLMLTAAVIADIDEAKYDYAQDWVKWVNDGIIDKVYPMAYRKDFDKFYEIAANIADLTPQENVIMGLRAWQEKGEPVYKVERIIEKAELCRKMGFGGIALFSYDGIKRLNYFPRLTQALFDPIELDNSENDEDNFITQITSSYNSNVSDTVSVSPETAPTQTVELFENEEQADNTTKPKAFCDNISKKDDKYYFSFFFEISSNWKWEIMDANRNLMIQKSRVYSPGYYIEEWDGIDSSGSLIQPGIYILQMRDSRDLNIFEKRFVID